MIKRAQNVVRADKAFLTAFCDSDFVSQEVLHLFVVVNLPYSALFCIEVPQEYNKMVHDTLSELLMCTLNVGLNPGICWKRVARRMSIPFPCTPLADVGTGAGCWRERWVTIGLLSRG